MFWQCLVATGTKRPKRIFKARQLVIGSTVNSFPEISSLSTVLILISESIKESNRLLPAIDDPGVDWVVDVGADVFSSPFMGFMLQDY